MVAGNAPRTTMSQGKTRSHLELTPTSDQANRIWNSKDPKNLEKPVDHCRSALPYVSYRAVVAALSSLVHYLGRSNGMA